MIKLNLSQCMNIIFKDPSASDGVFHNALFRICQALFCCRNPRSHQSLFPKIVARTDILKPSKACQNLHLWPCNHRAKEASSQSLEGCSQ